VAALLETVPVPCFGTVGSDYYKQDIYCCIYRNSCLTMQMKDKDDQYKIKTKHYNKNGPQDHMSEYGQ
jgi:hypothetical protein